MQRTTPAAGDRRPGATRAALQLVGGRLLDKLLHRVLRSEPHEPVGSGVLDRYERDRRPRPGALVLGELGGEVEVGEHVAVEQQEALVEHRLGELQRPRRAARVGLLDEAQADPEPRAVAQHVAHRGGEEAAGHDHVLDAVRAQPFDHVHDERPVHERHERLGHGGGQRAQTGALAADEDHGLHYDRSPCADTPAPSEGAPGPTGPAALPLRITRTPSWEPAPRARLAETLARSPRRQVPRRARRRRPRRCDRRSPGSRASPQRPRASPTPRTRATR